MDKAIFNEDGNTFSAATIQIAQMAGVCWCFSRSRLVVSSTFDIPFRLQSVACDSLRRYGCRHVMPEFIGSAAVSRDVVVRRKGGCSVYGLLNESASSANILMAWQIIARPPAAAAAAAASSSINQSVSWSANQSIFRYLAAAPNNQAVSDACRTIGRSPLIQYKVHALIIIFSLICCKQLWVTDFLRSVYGCVCVYD